MPRPERCEGAAPGGDVIARRRKFTRRPRCVRASYEITVGRSICQAMASTPG